MIDKPRYPGLRVTANGNQLVSYHTETRIADAGVLGVVGDDLVAQADRFTHHFAVDRLAGVEAGLGDRVAALLQVLVADV